MDGRPTRSPDRGRIAFQSDRDGNDEVYSMDANGGNVLQFTDRHSAEDGQPAWGTSSPSLRAPLERPCHGTEGHEDRGKDRDDGHPRRGRPCRFWGARTEGSSARTSAGR